MRCKVKRLSLFDFPKVHLRAAPEHFMFGTHIEQVRVCFVHRHHDTHITSGFSFN